MSQKSLIDDPEAVGLEWVEIFSTVIPGEPQQRGSKQAFVPQKGPKGEICPECKNPLRQPIRDQYGRVMVNMTDMNKDSGPYMDFARGWLKDKYGHGRKLIDCPIATSFRFYFARPQSHLGTGRNAGTVRKSAPEFNTSAPDESKLIRCLEDCLTETVWADDRFVVARLHPSGKFWTTGKARTELSVYVPARYAHEFEDNF